MLDVLALTLWQATMGAAVEGNVLTSQNVLSQAGSEPSRAASFLLISLTN